MSSLAKYFARYLLIAFVRNCSFLFTFILQSLNVLHAYHRQSQVYLTFVFSPIFSTRRRIGILFFLLLISFETCIVLIFMFATVKTHWYCRKSTQLVFVLATLLAKCHYSIEVFIKTHNLMGI